MAQFITRPKKTTALVAADKLHIIDSEDANKDKYIDFENINASIHIVTDTTYEFATFAEFQALIEDLKITLIEKGVIITLKATANITATSSIYWNFDKRVRIDLNGYNYTASGINAFVGESNQLYIYGGYILGDGLTYNAIYSAGSFDVITDSTDPFFIGKTSSDGFGTGINIANGGYLFLRNVTIKNCKDNAISAFLCDIDWEGITLTACTLSAGFLFNCNIQGKPTITSSPSIGFYGCRIMSTGFVLTTLTDAVFENCELRLVGATVTGLTASGDNSCVKFLGCELDIVDMIVTGCTASNFTLIFLSCFGVMQRLEVDGALNAGRIRASTLDLATCNIHDCDYGFDVWASTIDVRGGTVDTITNYGWKLRSVKMNFSNSTIQDCGTAFDEQDSEITLDSVTESGNTLFRTQPTSQTTMTDKQLVIRDTATGVNQFISDSEFLDAAFGNATLTTSIDGRQVIMRNTDGGAANRITVANFVQGALGEVVLITDPIVVNDDKMIIYSESEAAFRQEYISTIVKDVGLMYKDGWTQISGTFTYGSATTITTAQNLSGVLSKGMKLRWYHGSTEYQAYVISAVYSSPNTTITLVGEAVQSSAIASFYYSVGADPYGFKHWFDYTPILASTTGTITTYSITSAKFCMRGLTGSVDVVGVISDKGTGSVLLSLTQPFGTISSTRTGAVGWRESDGAQMYGKVNAGTTINYRLYNNADPIANTTYYLSAEFRI